jgi:hypothetical protein
VDSFETKQGSLLNAVPMLYQAQCSMSYNIFDRQLAGPAQDLDGTVIDTPPVNAIAKADYSQDVEGGAALLAIVGVAGATIKNPLERALALALVGGSAKVAADRMRETMTRAIPRTNDLALLNCLQPVFESLEKATLFRGRVTDVSFKDKTLTINAGSNNGVVADMEFSLLNAGIPAFDNNQRALKADMVVARVVEVQPDYSVCKLFRIEHTVSKKAYEDNPEAEYDEGLWEILSPSTGLTNARLMLRLKVQPK